MTNQTPTARVRYLLERGRTYNSFGSKDDARPLFVKAWELAKAINEHGLAVDAAHMVAIAETGDAVLKWNLIGLQCAEQSDQPKGRKWLASLYNNIGWTHHAAGEYHEALECFEKALIEQTKRGDEKLIRVARWCLARCLRSLGRTAESLERQLELESEAAEHARPDGFVQEEIAECLHELGRMDEAKPYFGRAHDILSNDPWLMESEPDRIERLRTLSN
jgi:tetratricopeptide (TPR) repeat protein